MEPQAAPVNCQVSVQVTQDDFDYGYARVAIEGIAVPRAASAPATITWNGFNAVPLIQIGRLHLLQVRGVSGKKGLESSCCACAGGKTPS